MLVMLFEKRQDFPLPVAGLRVFGDEIFQRMVVPLGDIDGIVIPNREINGDG
ncbi:hypothetical protein D3C87_1790520 [compost metagenome]